MPKPDTLLILSPGFPEDESDSTCLPLQQQLVLAFNRLAPELNIQVIAFQYPLRHGVYEWFGNQVWPLNGRGRGRLYRLVTWYRAWRRIRAVRRNTHLSGILSFWVGECALLGHQFARRNALPHFCWILGQDARAGNRYARRLRSYPKELAAVSDFLQETFKRSYGVAPAHVVPAGISANYFSPGWPERDIDIVAAGSLIALKRYDLLVTLVGALKKKHPAIKAVLCGAGPLLPQLQQQVIALGLEENITLAGERSHQETFKYMQRSRVFFHPSSYEGFSGACLEALYAGAHVVSFCAPMHAWIRHWHIVEDETEAIEKIDTLLRTAGSDNGPVLPYRIEDSASQLLQLFGFTLR